MTGALDSLLALLLALLLDGAIVLRVASMAPAGEVRFLTGLFAASVFVRYVLALVLNAYSTETSFAAMFWGDSSTYDVRAHVLAEHWSGELAIVQRPDSMVSGWGFYVFVAAVYYVFGRNQLLVQLLNGTIGALNALVIYAIAATVFDTRVARRAALFMAFFPQMVVWSAGMYKDAAIILCLGCCILAVLRLGHRFEMRYAALFVVASLILLTLRFYVFYIVAFATVTAFLFSQRRGVVQSLASYALLLGLFLTVFSYAVQNETIEQQRSFFDLERVQTARLDQASRAGSGFAADIDVSTPQGALAVLPIGLLYLFFAPFPWSGGSLRQLLTLPEMLVWYALLPSLVRGLRYSVRERLRECLPILIFAGMLTLAYAVFQGNVGTVYRQRTQITMFLFIFMGVGLVERERQREQRLARTDDAGLARPA